jgi:PAS domain S-box-containing protein
MYDSTITLSRVGIILNMDVDCNDTLFEPGVDYIHKNFTILFKSSQTQLLKKFLDKVFTTCKLQCIEFLFGNSLYQLKCIISQPGQAICIITNNTRQLKLLSELEGHNQKMLAGTYKDWVWSFDTNFTLVTANEAFLEGRRKLNNESLHIGDNIFKYVNDAVYKKWLPIYERALKGETVCFEEQRANLGIEYYAEIYLTPVYNTQNEIIGCLGVTRDVTERKNAQLAVESYTAKLEDFAFKTSHELRRPIANIMGMVTLLGNGGLNSDDRKKTVDFVASSVNELDKVVKDMIDLVEQYKK